MNNSVFISYRRSVGGYFALAVLQNLRAHKINAFKDVESIDAGQFDTVILNQIAARPYFLLLLTPGTLDRCGESGDWLLREIEHAMKLNRVIIPLVSHNFDFKDMKTFLAEPLASELPRFQAVNVPYEYFDEAMKRLRTRFLKPTDIPVMPPSKADEITMKQKEAEIAAEPTVTEDQLSAQDYFERALKRPENDLDGIIADYSEAIRLNPNYGQAYNNRAVARIAKGDVKGSLEDHNETIRLLPNAILSYYNRAKTYHDNGDFERAIDDFNEVIRIDPNYAEAYSSRGIARIAKGDIKSALKDHNEAIRLNPNAIHYNNRGAARSAKKDWDGAIKDFNKAIRINPNYATAYNNRGIAFQEKGNLDKAIKDYSEAISIDPNYANSYYNRATARHDLGGEDIADYSEAIRLNPNFANAYHNRAVIYAANMKYKAAIADGQKFLELVPNGFHAEKMRNDIAQWRKRIK